jgi:hypothetical protein
MALQAKCVIDKKKLGFKTLAKPSELEFRTKFLEIEYQNSNFSHIEATTQAAPDSILERCNFDSH